MNRIKHLFETKKEVLSIYFTAGYPTLNDTATIIEHLENNGADLIEIGLPFSDPLADGPTIQQSSEVALNNGMTTALLFEQLQDIRKKVKLPLIIMGYLNPILQYGVEAFCEKCKEVGIDGVILPDLPIAIYETHYQAVFKSYGLENIFLITPQTARERIQKIDVLSNGFIYMVSASSTTGAKKGFDQEQMAYFNRIKAMQLNNPTVIGFGIANHTTYQQACTSANGAIIGSAFINALKAGDLENSIQQFMQNMLQPVSHIY